MTASKASAYDKYVDYKRFGIAVGLFVAILMIPIPNSMLDVAVEYQMGESYVLDYYSQELFEKPFKDIEQWQVLTVRALEGCMIQGVSRKGTILKRDSKNLQKMGITGHEEHFTQYQALLKSLDESKIRNLLLKGRELRHEKLTYAMLTPVQKEQVNKAA